MARARLVTDAAGPATGRRRQRRSRSIRYEVIAYEPGRRVRFGFAPGLGLDGWHEAHVTAVGAQRCVLTHVIEGQLRRQMRLAWPLVIRPLHDAVIEDLLGNAELAATGRLDHPARWSPWVSAALRLRNALAPLVDDDTVTLSTVARTNNARGGPTWPSSSCSIRQWSARCCAEPATI